MASHPISRNDVLRVLSRHIGRDNGAHVGQLVNEITRGPTSECLERELRRVITELRLEGYHICAYPGDGYFMASDTGELDDTCRFLLERSMSSIRQIAAMKRISVPDLEGQLHLDI